MGNRSHRLIGALIAVVLTSCGSPRADQARFVDLSQRQPLPAAAETDVVPLRIAVASIISPEGTVDSYRGLADYLGAQLGRSTELIQRRTYAEVNELVAQQSVDLAFVCTSAYVTGHDEFGMELLVAPEIAGQAVYHSQLIVPSDSRAASMADLHGTVFAFTDPMSNTGRAYPTYLVHQLGETPATFFQRTFFTYGHDRAIEAVANGIADGAAVDSLVLDFALKRDPALRERISIVHESPAFGIPPVVVPPDLPPRRKVELRELLLNMATDPSGEEVLAQMGIDHFVETDDGEYDGVRSLLAAAEAGP